MAMDLLICPITPKFLSRSPNPSENVCRWDLPLRTSPTDATCWTTPTPSAALTGTTRARSAEKFATAFIFNTGGTELRVLRDCARESPAIHSIPIQTGDGVRHNRQTPHLEWDRI